MTKHKQEYTVTFVCSGNSCRSPLAEAISKNLTGKSKLRKKLNFTSAGVSAISNLPANENARRAAQKMGYSLDEHRTRSVFDITLNNSDLIFVFEPRHKNYLIDKFPGLESKVFLLTSLEKSMEKIKPPENSTLEDRLKFIKQKLRESNCKQAIQDPLGEGVEKYLEIGSRIEKTFSRMLEFLEGD